MDYLLLLDAAAGAAPSGPRELLVWLLALLAALIVLAFALAFYIVRRAHASTPGVPPQSWPAAQAPGEQEQT